MTTLYLIRHGTTDSNMTGNFQGISDIPLNALGLKQAACLGTRFDSIHLDRIYSSPLERAKQTAKGLCGQKDLAIELAPDLIEVNGGLLEGRTIVENNLDFPGVMDTFKNDIPNFQAPEGENTRQVYDRVTAGIQALIAENKGKTIACVSHGFAIQTFLCYAEGTAFENMQQKIVRNTAVCKFVFDDDGSLHTLYINDNRHLPEELVYSPPIDISLED